MHPSQNGPTQRRPISKEAPGTFRLVKALCLAGVLSLADSAGAQTAPPGISTQPQSQSVSLGAKATFSAIVMGTPPVQCQWQQNGLDLLGATNATLVLTNVKRRDAGAYTLVAVNVAGSVTSTPALLDVDPTFTKITTGPIVSDSGSAWACAWGDYDNDGLLDLYVANAAIGEENFFYHNLGGGTFQRTAGGGVVANTGVARGCLWADVNNRGRLDLFVMNFSGNNLLYYNNGNGTFAQAVGVAPVLDAGEHSSCAWGDYDNDGNIDLFVGAHMEKGLLYRNNGDGTFTQIFSGDIVNDIGHCVGSAWADYDNKGRLDLLVGNHRMLVFLYHNNGDGSFSKVTEGRLANDRNDAHGIAWGDYDNDGFLDVFFASESGADALYHNNGDGTFTRVPTNQIATITAHSYGCSWADYDNDGFLDVFVVKAGGKNLLYHNNGDGTFTQTTSGSPANDAGYSYACAWADYDNDGFLDLFVANWQRTSFLYHNNGNSNNWLNVRCVGTASNRGGVGAKVRVRATIRGQVQWQLREISGGRSGNQDDPRASFGLGDAAVADVVRIEWPSGIVQEMQAVRAKQFLTVTEPPRLSPLPTLNGQDRVQLLGGVGQQYVMEGSSDLTNWTPVAIVTNRIRTTTWTNPIQSYLPARFYRAVGAE